MKSLHRRKFIQQTSLLTLGTLATSAVFASKTNEEIKKIKIGLIGVGFRGQVHLSELLKREDVTVTAIADPDEKMVAMAEKIVFKSGKQNPVVYINGNQDYKNLILPA